MGVQRVRITERQFQDRVIAEARLRGWLVAHFRPLMNRHGKWSTAMQGDPGFPDLVMARPPRLIFAELKSDKGKTSPAQDAWLAALRGQIDAEVYLWRPDDADYITQVLA